MSGFRGFRKAGDQTVGRLSPAEAKAVGHVAELVSAMVGVAGDGGGTAGLERLFPDASADEEVAGEFRRLTQDDAVAAYADRLAVLSGAVEADRIAFASTSGNDVLMAFGYCRLMLGGWLGIDEADVDEDIRAKLAEPDVRDYYEAVYDLFTYLQDNLTRLQMRSLPPPASLLP